VIHEPKNLTLHQKQEIIRAARYKVEKGGVISCGHDFWEHAKDIPYGDIILCTRCYQYFVKMNGLPWWNDGDANGEFDFQKEPRLNHLDEKHGFPGAWFHAVDIRLQDCHGNTIEKR